MDLTHRKQMSSILLTLLQSNVPSSSSKLDTRQTAVRVAVTTASNNPQHGALVSSGNSPGCGHLKIRRDNSNSHPQPFIHRFVKVAPEGSSLEPRALGACGNRGKTFQKLSVITTEMISLHHNLYRVK
ncbi:hypothetical protein BaRGS_00014497 [Batillaria attramentaria]|uniref:Uncharacterized protein n=1 Tax=Batillaria attramentaria TaxID=370345 RepID=A0ABD0L4Z1_9CAEN